jgi:hypothetical protein
MGESSKDALGVVFDGSLKLEFHGSKVTSSGIGMITETAQNMENGRGDGNGSKA